MTTTDTSLGDAVALLRTTRRMTRKELAKAADISYPYLCEIENNSKDPSWKVFRSLCTALKVGPAAFMRLVEDIEGEVDLRIPAPNDAE